MGSRTVYYHQSYKGHVPGALGCRRRSAKPEQLQTFGCATMTCTNKHFIDFPFLIREALVQHSVCFADDVRCGAKGGARLDEAVKCTRIGTHRKRRGFAIVGRQASATQYSSPKSPKMLKFGPGEAEINKIHKNNTFQLPNAAKQTSCRHRDVKN